MQPKGYFHSTYSAKSDSEGDLLVDKSLGMQPNSYFYATYHAGSACESNSLVHKSHSLQPKSHFHATYISIQRSRLQPKCQWKQLINWYIRVLQPKGYTDTSSWVSIEVALWLQAITLMHQWVAFTHTSSIISSMEVAVWLHAETLVHKWVTFTVTSSMISSMEVAVWLHAKTLVSQWVSKATHWYTIVIGFSQRDTSMLLILPLLEVTVKATHLWMSLFTFVSIHHSAL